MYVSEGVWKVFESEGVCVWNVCESECGMYVRVWNVCESEGVCGMYVRVRVWNVCEGVFVWNVCESEGVECM